MFAEATLMKDEEEQENLGVEQEECLMSLLRIGYYFVVIGIVLISFLENQFQLIVL